MMFDVLPLSPERTCATCCSFSSWVQLSYMVMTGFTASRGTSEDHTPMTSRVRSWCGTRLPVMPTPDTAMPSTSRPTLIASSRVLRARRDPHCDLVGLRLILRRDGPAVDCIQANEIDAQLLGLELHDLEALLQDLLGELRAPQRAGAGIEEHILADEAFGAADRHFQRRRARLAGDMRDAYAVVADLLEPGRGEIHHHVRRDVVGRGRAPRRTAAP